MHDSANANANGNRECGRDPTSRRMGYAIVLGSLNAERLELDVSLFSPGLATGFKGMEMTSPRARMTCYTYP